MGEHVNMGNGQIGYAADPWEVDTTSFAPLKMEHIRAAYSVLEESGEHRLDPDITLSRLMAILGPAITEHVFTELLRRNRPLFLGLPPDFLQNVIKDQRQKGAV